MAYYFVVFGAIYTYTGKILLSNDTKLTEYKTTYMKLPPGV